MCLSMFHRENVCASSFWLEAALGWTETLCSLGVHAGEEGMPPSWFQLSTCHSPELSEGISVGQWVNLWGIVLIASWCRKAWSPVSSGLYRKASSTGVEEQAEEQHFSVVSVWTSVWASALASLDGGPKHTSLFPLQVTFGCGVCHSKRNHANFSQVRLSVGTSCHLLELKYSPVCKQTPSLILWNAEAALIITLTKSGSIKCERHK